MRSATGGSFIALEMVPQDRVKRRTDRLSVCHFYCLENFPVVLDESDNYVWDKWMELFLNLCNVPRQPTLIVNRGANNSLRPDWCAVNYSSLFQRPEVLSIQVSSLLQGVSGSIVSRKSLFHISPFRESRRRDLRYARYSKLAVGKFHRR